MRPEIDVERTRAFWLASKPGEPAAPAYVSDPPHGWYVALALGAALLLQVSLAPLLTVRGAVAPLVALLTGWYALRTGSLRGLAFGLIAGACEDALAGTTGAAWTIASGLGGACAGRLARTWLADTTLALVPGAALLTLLRFGTFVLVMQIEGRPIALPLIHLHAALWQSLEAALLTLIVLRFFPDLGGLGAHRR